MRTVHRDIDALSLSGVPVYAERGRHGGFALLPGLAADLTGLSLDEAQALLTATSPHDAGTAPALASALRKIVDALPDQRRTIAQSRARRVLVTPDGWLREATAEPALADVERAVFAGRRLRFHYVRGERVEQRTVDPWGLIHTTGRWYLVAAHLGRDRIYRVSRMRSARVLEAAAQVPDDLDLETWWAKRRQSFLTSRDQVQATIAVAPDQVADARAIAVDAQETGILDDGRVVLAVRLAGEAHAFRLLWQLGPEAELLTPADLRSALRRRAGLLADRHG